MKIVKKADVVWNGGIKDGKGAITTGSGAHHCAAAAG
jgi:hypothetical protein